MGHSNRQSFEKQKRGDIAYDFYADNWDVLHIGTSGQGLVVSSGLPAWGYPAGLNISGQAQGDILYFNGTSWVRLAAGTAGQALITGGASANPAWGPGAWSTYTPTITAGSGTFTTVSGSGRYFQMGKILFLTAIITITTNGTAGTYIVLPLPGGMTVGSIAAVLAGRESTNGKMLQGIASNGATTVLILNYDNTYPGASGNVCIVTGMMELA